MNKKKSLIFFILFSAMTASQLQSQDFQTILEEGDSLLEKTFDLQKAYNVYLEAHKLQPDDWEINWRLSRVLSLKAEQMPESIDSQKEAKLSMFKNALEYAEKAVKNNGEQSITYLYRALANGRIALLSGIFSVSGIMDNVREDINKALSLNNASPFFMALSNFELGRAHFELCEKSYLIRLPLGLGWANMKDALFLFKQAIELYPDYRLFHLYAAKTYIELEENEEAEKHLRKIPLIKPNHFNDDKFLAESVIMLDKLK